MSMFMGVSNIGDSLLNDQIEGNLSTFFDYGMLTIGAFFNVRIPSSGAYGGNQHQLRLSDDPNYPAGGAWEGFRTNWVFEQNIPYSTQPINISGIYVNNAYLPIATTGIKSYYIDYPNGRVIFNTPIAQNSVVTLEFSYKYYAWSTADVPWFRDVFFDSFRVDDPHFSQIGSGIWSTASTTRVQMPAIIVESVPKRKFIGKQLGGGFTVQQEIEFHIFSETSFERKQAIDVITYQIERTIPFFDKNKILSANTYPLNGYGSLVSGAIFYPQFVNPTGGYFWRNASLREMYVLRNKDYLPLFTGSVKGLVEVDLPEI